MRVALDTNRLTDLLGGDKQLEEALESYREIYIPLPVLAELKVGLLGGSGPAENERHIRQFLRKPGTHLLFPAKETADQYAKLFLQLRKAGTPIPINDVWIAALVLEHDLTLITRDSHFDRVPQLLTSFL